MTFTRDEGEMFGTVISFVDEIPDEFIDSEWDLIKRVQFGQTVICGPPSWGR